MFRITEIKRSNLPLVNDQKCFIELENEDDGVVVRVPIRAGMFCYFNADNPNSDLIIKTK